MGMQSFFPKIANIFVFLTGGMFGRGGQIPPRPQWWCDIFYGLENQFSTKSQNKNLFKHAAYDQKFDLVFLEKKSFFKKLWKIHL